jgi:single-strand DNA-binding protein
MSTGLNKIMLIGILGRDPEKRFSPLGTPVTTFSILVNRVNLESGPEAHLHMDVFNVITCGDLAVTCFEQLSKNHEIYLEGRIQTHQWVNDAGVKNCGVEIFAHEVITLGDYKNEMDEK